MHRLECTVILLHVSIRLTAGHTRHGLAHVAQVPCVGSPATATSSTTEFANAIVNASSRLVTSPAFVSALPRAFRFSNLSHITTNASSVSTHLMRTSFDRLMITISRDRFLPD